MGSYVRKTLSEGETVIARATFSFIRFFWPLFWIACLCWLISQTIGINSVAITYARLIVYFIIGLLLWDIISLLADEVTLTNQRIIAKRGILSRFTLDLQLSEVESVSADLPFIQSRLFNAGALIITGVGGSSLAVPGIKNVIAFRKIIQDTLNEKRAHATISQAAVSVPQSQEENSVESKNEYSAKEKIELLVKLKRLLDEGVLSQEEFQSEKERIMNNT